MDPSLLPFAERAAPRYTSYPSAPHFIRDVDGEVQNRWLQDIRPSSTLSLYLHVPYCRHICWYCGCNTYAARRNAPLLDYVATLLKEIELVGSALAPKRVEEIHWGGGTPNILYPASFSAIIGKLRATFDLSGLSHHAIEIDPRQLDAEKCAAYVAAGVNRASLGVQDLNLHVQEAIGRVQPLELVQAAVELLRRAGVETLSMDLMFGLPNQTVRDLRNTVLMAADMRPQRIALFGYAHVPWFKKRQRLIEEASLPGPAERFDQAEMAREQLTARGYQAIGLDHFALPEDALAVAARSGKLRRSFQGYVTGGDETTLIGLGPSAISTLPQGYTQSLAEVGAWAQAVHDGCLPCARGHALSEDDYARRRLIEQIMCDFEGDLRLIGGRGACMSELIALQSLIDAGLAEIDDERVLVKPKARPFCRLVAQAFDAYAESSTSRHSRAI